MSEPKHPDKLIAMEGFGQKEHLDTRYYIGSPDLPQAVFVTSGGNDKALAERLVLVWNSYDELEEKKKELVDAVHELQSMMLIARNQHKSDSEQLQTRLAQKEKLIAHLEGRETCLETRLDKLSWRKVSEGLPEERDETVPFRSKEVIVTDGDKWVRALWLTRLGHWHFFHFITLSGEVTHWMPIDLPSSEEVTACKTCNNTGQIAVKAKGCACVYCRAGLNGCQITRLCPDCQSEEAK